MKSILFALVSTASLYAGSLPLEENLNNRHSGYAFDSTKTVSADQIESLIQAARMAPSSYNDQPWNYIICDKTTNPAGFQKALSCLAEPNQNWAKNVSVLMIAVASEKKRTNEKTNRWAIYDTGASSMSICVQATSLGLMVHQMGGFDTEKVVSEFKIPDGNVPISVLAIGYEDKSAQPQTKNRISQSENFFQSTWSQPYKG